MPKLEKMVHKDIFLFDSEEEILIKAEMEILFPPNFPKRSEENVSVKNFLFTTLTEPYEGWVKHLIRLGEWERHYLPNLNNPYRLDNSSGEWLWTSSRALIGTVEKPWIKHSALDRVIFNNNF